MKTEHAGWAHRALYCSHSFCMLGSPAGGVPEPDPAVVPAMQASGAIDHVDSGVLLPINLQAASRQYMNEVD